MVDFKVVIGHQGKSYQREVKNADSIVGMKIGDTLQGDTIGLEGYEFQITGGSDNCGFPMRKDLPGVRRMKIYTARGKGVKTNGEGMIRRKSVTGNTINERIAQINLKVLKEGKEKLGGEAKEEAAK